MALSIEQVKHWVRLLYEPTSESDLIGYFFLLKILVKFFKGIKIFGEYATIVQFVCIDSIQNYNTKLQSKGHGYQFVKTVQGKNATFGSRTSRVHS